MTNQIKDSSNTKKLTRDDIMAMARYEYARQLCIYTKAQLTNGLKRLPNPRVNTSNNVNTANTTTLIC
ncbi:hypothetical protein MFLAVUS_008581 [Mucor flavus]|uniref:Uncharacterized protein n=1 Tax=Mucor flavus TaxID=439312 RepID=A0ABP9Z7I4_9FUNG